MIFLWRKQVIIENKLKGKITQLLLAAPQLAPKVHNFHPLLAIGKSVISSIIICELAVEAADSRAGFTTTVKYISRSIK